MGPKNLDRCSLDNFPPTAPGCLGIEVWTQCTHLSIRCWNPKTMKVAFQFNTLGLDGLGRGNLYSDVSILKSSLKTKTSSGSG